MSRLAAAPSVSGTVMADLRDDGLLGHDEAATLILGLQDRTTRDRAAEWMEGDEAGPALRLWRALARRCVGPYSEHAAAPLTLAGWVAWSTGDDLEAREALAMALGADPGYLFARLLHQACNEGLDPESIRRCLRAERDGREPMRSESAEVTQEPALSEAAGSDPCAAPTSASASRRRRRARPASASDDSPRSAKPKAREPRPKPKPSRPRTTAAVVARPAAARAGGTRTRASAKGAAHGAGNPGDLHAKGDSQEEDT
jgi:hypothetical protein